MKKIICDSGANLLPATINNVSCVNVPLTMQIDGQTWQDDEQLNLKQFAAKLSQTKQPATSSCPNLSQWLEAYEGSDEVYVITITSVLSGSYNAALQAATIYQEKYPQAKIHVFDSRSVGPTMRLIAEELAKLIHAEHSFDQIIAEIDDFINEHAELLFALGSLDNLAANGRVNSVLAKIAHLMNLRVIGTAEQGDFKMITKARGAKKAYRILFEQMIEKGYHGGQVWIDHVQNLAGATKMQELILRQFPHAQIQLRVCHALCTFYAEQNGLMIGFTK